MQEKVVYFLGAGFSQPRGLPVMSNFIDKSKELHRLNPQNYGCFADVFSKIADIAIATKYFEADLYNIEEILSILEMSTQLETQPEGESPSESFRDYIVDVISAYTPKIEPYLDGLQASNWDEYIFGSKNDIWKYYGQFVASLHNLTVGKHLKGGTALLGWQRVSNPKTRYDIISLNYDCVLETVCDFLNAHYQAGCPLRFQRTESDKPATELGLPWLVKLHGSADKPEDIIPPTWSKTLTKNSIQEQWKAAHRLLSEADHIRVLGYSLPTSDAYVQYLLKSSVIRTERETFAPLKTFHVITLDSDGKTRDRYESLIKFRGFRFVDASIEIYFRHIEPTMRRPEGREKQVRFTTLEDAHEEFMDLAERFDWKIPDSISLPPPPEPRTY
jgi:hypothetical protein